MSTNVPDSEMLPSCLAEISPILRVANNLQHTHPRMAYLCVCAALKETIKIDPSALGTGVHKSTISLRTWIERNDETSGKGGLQPSDAPDMQSFYLNFYEENIQALINTFRVNKHSKAIDSSSSASVPALEAASPPNENLASTSHSVRANRSQLLTKACQTALTLYKIIVLLWKDVPLPLEILEAHTKVKRQAQIFKPYNIVPFDTYTDDHPIRRLTEIQAAIPAFLKR